MEGASRRGLWTGGIAAFLFALLALIGIWTTAPGIERDLETRAAAALAAAGVSNVTASADGRTITLTGPARDPAARDAALAAAAVFGVSRVVDAFGAAPPGSAAAGYRFQADWDGAALALSGLMPSLDDQESLVADARDVFPRARIADSLRVQPNPPAESWPDAAKGALRALRALAKGRVVIEGATVTLSGVAPSEAARGQAGDLLAGLPEPYTMLLDIEVGDVAPPATPAPYRFGAAYDGASLALSGALPSPAARDALKAGLGKTPLDDKTRIDPAAPDGAFADAAGTLLTALLGRTASFTLALEDRTIALAAIAPDAKAAKAIEAALQDLPAAYDWRATVDLAGAAPAAPLASPGESPARACQAAMSAALAETPVVFASASAALPDSAGTLVDSLAAIAATCPAARIEIAGHTDASGNAARNVALSEDRAAALEAALIVKGVDAARLSAKGYGAARPVAANDSDANKARNRRIEVIVRP